MIAMEKKPALTVTPIEKAHMSLRQFRIIDVAVVSVGELRKSKEANC